MNNTIVPLPNGDFEVLYLTEKDFLSNQLKDFDTSSSKEDPEVELSSTSK